MIRALASLRLTVALLALSMALVFVGTIAQTRVGVWQVVDGYFRSPVAWVDLSAFSGTSSSFRVPMPGGALLGIGLLVNLVAAHVVRFGATRRKAGILAIHAGLIVLLAGEFVTGAASREGLMRIDEGGSTSYLEDVRRVELAVVDASDPGFDRVVSVPGGLVRQAAASGRAISDARLPFEIRVDRWLGSADLWRAPEGGVPGGNPATQGIGVQAFARAAPTARGVDGAGSDLPAAYVTLLRDGRVLGTWLGWAGLDELQEVRVDGSTYGISLRFARTYLPFRLHLSDFRHDVFEGTSIARNFSSDVRIEDAEWGVDRPVRIWMNNPLRYRGLAFYQASYKPDGSGTVLQVVRNPGWLLPYVACAMVGLGLAWQFGSSLSRFLRRSRQNRHGMAHPGASPHAERSGGWGASLPRARRWGMVAGVGLAALIGAAPLAGPRAEPGLEIFARLPVSAGGRVKPMDTAARNLLMVAGGRGSIRTEEGRVSAVRFLLDLVALPPEATRDLPIARVDDPGVLSLLGRSPEEGGRLGLSAVEPYWGAVAEQAGRASQIEARERDSFQRAVLNLHSRVNSVLAHAQLREPLVVAPLRGGKGWRSFHEVFMEDAASLDAGRTPGAVGADAARSEFEPHPAIAYYTAMMTAYAAGDTEGFERAVRGYDELLARDLPGARHRARLEVLFNRASPFLSALTMYGVAILALLASFLLRQLGDRWAGRGADACYAGATGLIWSGVLLHTVAILGRMWLQERPPVTNLYSSAVFVGWAAALLGMLVERVFPVGLSALGSAGIGLCTLIVAHNLGNDGDTMQMMQAVLDSNFWLATHVVTITLGYSAAFLAAALAGLWILASACRRLRMQSPEGSGDGGPASERLRMLSKATYGVVCFALLLSFVGTVLGGIWADQSWGRFWGWDPKENGAALIVLHLSLIVHARWGGLTRERGLAVLAVGGGIVTAWSWFGTNMLGTGLHSYGFTDSAATWLAGFVGSQIALMSLGIWAGRQPASQPGPA